MRTIVATVAGLLLAIAPLVGQNSPLAGPVMGLVPDSAAQGIRPILGIPGAAAAGAPVSLPVPLRQALTSNEGNYAAGITEPDGTVVIVHNPLAEPVIRPVPGAVDGATKAALSPNGRILAMATAEQIQVIDDAGGNPYVSRTVPNPAALDSPLAVLAADDAGNVAAASETGAVYWIGRQSPARIIGTVARASAIAFAGPDRLVIADRVRGEIVQIANVSSNPARFTLADRGDGILEPAALAVGRGGTEILVADPAARAIIVIGLSNGWVSTFACSCQPNRLAPLRRASMFAVTEAGAGPLMVFDASAPRFLAVPVR